MSAPKLHDPRLADDFYAELCSLIGSLDGLVVTLADVAEVTPSRVQRRLLKRTAESARTLTTRLRELGRTVTRDTEEAAVRASEAEL